MNISASSAWSAPSHWHRIVTVDAHTEGEPLRVIIGGYPDLEGSTILDRRQDASDRLDHLRTALMWEPRGHADMYGCLVTPPVTDGADFGVLFMHNEGYSTMCGHGIIAVTRVAVETGMVPAVEPVTELRIDTPAGPVTSFARVGDGQVQSVYFRNVPSYVVGLDEWVDVAGLGRIRFDLAFGGAYYAFVNVEDVGLSCTPKDLRALMDCGMSIKHAVAATREIKHPFDEPLGFLYGTIFVGPPEATDAHSRNVCVFAESEVDRSPTGTGVSARAAIHHTRGELQVGDAIVIESIIGTRFRVTVLESTVFGPHPAVIPEVEGRAFITGRHEFLIEPKDPLQGGFILR